MSDEPCGHPTENGRPCRNRPIGGPNERCFRHSGIPSTEAQLAANRKHGGFVSGFLSEEERARYEELVRDGVVPAELRRHIIAALRIRAERLMRWEGSGERGEKMSSYTTDTFAELRQALDAWEDEEPAEGSAPSDVDIIQRLEEVLRSDRELLLRQLPDEVRAAAEAAWAALDAKEAAWAGAGSAGEA